jgi:3-hydroxymyristoyl/3-hydroxydecanoyl-(acyl carrier protein) dehydratase
MDKQNMKKIYEEIERAFQFENNKNFVFKIDKDFVAFRGHFPRQPLLPGIVQMEIALFCIKKLLNDETLNIGEAIKVKFIKPILPETKITVFIETKNEVFKAVIKDDKEIYSQMQLKVSSGKDDLPAEICEAQK